MAAPPRRVLAIKLADLGDALTITPALRAMRDSWPAARIDVLTSAAGHTVLCGLDSIDRMFVADKHQFDSPRGFLSPRGLAGLLPLLWRLRGERYDLVLLFHHLTTRFGALKYRLLTAAVAGRRCAGLDNGRGHFLDVRVPDRGFGALHEVDYNLAVATAAGATLPHDPHLEVAQEPPAGDARTPILPPGDWIALHCGGGVYSLARRWPPAAFAETGRRLAERTSSRIVILGGEVDKEASHELARLLGGKALNLTGKTSLQETAGVLSRCRLLVSNDSGVVHIASAVGTPVVAIFGPSNAEAWGPYPPAAHRVVRASLPCAPCFYRGTSLGTPQGCPTRDCLRLVTPEMVVGAAKDLLASKRAA